MIAGILGDTGAIVVWVAAICAVLLSVVLAGAAIRLERPRLGLAGLIPLVLGVLVAALHIDLTAPDPVYRDLLALALAALGVVGGYPVTVFVLGLASPKRRKSKKSDADADDGDHGGIVVDAKDGKPGKREVLRGGWVIGYLERIAVIAATALGRFEIVAALIAVKGLGRFTELDNSIARERFIIGTLTSLTWAAACGLLIAVVRS
jgi:hypothetical protein